MSGYPSVSFLNSSGHEVGYAAKSVNLTNEPITTITLHPGAYANAAVGFPTVATFPASRCDAETATQLRLYPPRTKTPLLLSFPVTLCTTLQGRTSVTPIRAGLSATPVAG